MTSASSEPDTGAPDRADPAAPAHRTSTRTAPWHPVDAGEPGDGDTLEISLRQRLSGPFDDTLDDPALPGLGAVIVAEARRAAASTGAEAPARAFTPAPPLAETRTSPAIEPAATRGAEPALAETRVSGAIEPPAASPAASPAAPRGPLAATLVSGTIEPPAPSLARARAGPPRSAADSQISGLHLPPLRETLARAVDGRPRDATLPGGADPAVAETLPSASSTLRGPIVVTERSGVDPRGPRDPRDPRESAPLPRRIGRFAVLRRLGAGGMGTVYAGFDEELGRRVAIKVLHVAVGAPRELRALLLAEARAMARLSHPHVVQVHELGEHEGGIFLVMEYIEGPTLEVWLKAAARPWEAILRAFLAAGEGLAAAHQAGIVHRDFKPDNVLMAGGEVPKVADFGLARPGDQAIAQIAGTPAYMSPEQHLGEPADARSDLFSFCVALHGALYGEAPFAGDTLAALRESVTAGALRPTPARSPVPARARAAVAAGLARAPEARPASMDALLAELRAALPRGPSPWPARLGLGALAAALAALAVVVLLRPASPKPAEFAAVADGARIAHLAAAEAEWIYPGEPGDGASPAEPGRTAIRRVVALEGLEGAAGEFARRQAGRLRQTFGGELAALGDRYWEDPQTRPWARDFYAQALVFLPDHAAALGRGNFSPGQLAELRERALAGSFTAEELAAVAPLKILADLDDPDLAAKIAALSRSCEAPVDEAAASGVRGGLSGGAGATPGESDASAPSLAAPGDPGDPGDPGERGTPGDSDPATPAESATPAAEPADEAAAPRPSPSRARVDALIAQAENARRQGKDDEAARLFDQALAQSPRDATATAGLSDIAFDRGDFREAARLAERAIKLDPDIGEHHTRRGDAHFKLGKVAEARKDFEKALALGDGRARRRLDLLQEAAP